MLNITLVIVHFFTERKRVIQFSCPEEKLEAALHRIGEAFPESFLSAHSEGEEILVHRPKQMMKEKAEVLAGSLDPFLFSVKWRLFFGEQIIPNLSLPGTEEKAEEEISPEDLVPHRAEFVEIVPSSVAL
jgi:hypothetical protein